MEREEIRSLLLELKGESKEKPKEEKKDDKKKKKKDVKRKDGKENLRSVLSKNYTENTVTDYDKKKKN